MSVDKLVDSTQLDADLTSVANAIRTKGGTSAQLAFPAGFVSAINDISGGGGGNADSDYITVYADIVIVGANNVTNATQISPYLLGLANMPTSGKYATIWSVVNHSGTWQNNAAICIDVATVGTTGPKFYRYRNGSIAATSIGSSYDASLKVGDQYLVATYYKKGVPS